MAKLTDLWVNIGAKTDQLDKGLNQAQNKLKGFGDVVSRIGGLIAGAFAVSKIAAFTVESIKMAAVYDEVEAGFKRLNNPNLLSNLRKAVNGTVDDLTLMKAAVRAESLGIPIKQLATYFEFAERKAGELGVSTEQAIEAIVNGIGNKSTRALKLLGISSIELNKQFGEIEPTVLSVGEVSKKVFEIVNKQLGDMGGNTESAADKIDQLNAAWKNTKVIIGEVLMPIVTQFVTLLNKAVLGWQNILNPQKLSGDMASNEINRITESLKGLSQEDALKVLQSELSTISKLSSDLSGQKFFIFGKGLKEANQTLSAYSQISSWLKTLFYDVKALNSLRTPDVIEPVKTPGGEAKTISEDKQFVFKHGILPDPEESRLALDLLPDVRAEIESIGESYTKAGIAAWGFAQAVSESATNVESLKDFANAVRQAARQTIAAMVAEAITSQVAKAMKNSKNPWVALLVGSAAGAATAALFSKIIPSFAEGGITKGPTLAMVGDNPSGKEAMIPSELWGKMGSTRVTGELQLRGRDAYWILKNYSDFLNKTT